MLAKVERKLPQLKKGGTRTLKARCKQTNMSEKESLSPTKSSMRPSHAFPIPNALQRASDGIVAADATMGAAAPITTLTQISPKSKKTKSSSFYVNTACVTKSDVSGRGGRISLFVVDLQHFFHLLQVSPVFLQRREHV